MFKWAELPESEEEYWDELYKYYLMPKTFFALFSKDAPDPIFVDQDDQVTASLIKIAIERSSFYDFYGLIAVPNNIMKENPKLSELLLSRGKQLATEYLRDAMREFRSEFVGGQGGANIDLNRVDEVKSKLSVEVYNAIQAGTDPRTIDGISDNDITALLTLSPAQGTQEQWSDMMGYYNELSSLSAEESPESSKIVRAVDNLSAMMHTRGALSMRIEPWLPYALTVKSADPTQPEAVQFMSGDVKKAMMQRNKEERQKYPEDWTHRSQFLKDFVGRMELLNNGTREAVSSMTQGPLIEDLVTDTKLLENDTARSLVTSNINKISSSIWKDALNNIADFGLEGRNLVINGINKNPELIDIDSIKKLRENGIPPEVLLEGITKKPVNEALALLTSDYWAFTDWQDLLSNSIRNGNNDLGIVAIKRGKIYTNATFGYALDVFDEELAREILNNGDINKTEAFKRAVRNNEDLANEIITKGGVDFNEIAYYAMQTENNKLLDYAMENDADLNAVLEKTVYNNTARSKQIIDKAQEMGKELDPNLIANYAIFSKNIGLLKELIDQGNLTNLNGLLQSAASQLGGEAVNLLIDAGATVADKSPVELITFIRFLHMSDEAREKLASSSDLTPLQVAIIREDIKDIDIMFEKAIELGDLDVVNDLFKNRVSNTNYVKVLTKAIMSDQPEMIDLFISQLDNYKPGVDYNLYNILIQAASKGDQETLTKLMTYIGPENIDTYWAYQLKGYGVDPSLLPTLSQSSSESMDETIPETMPIDQMTEEQQNQTLSNWDQRWYLNYIDKEEAIQAYQEAHQTEEVPEKKWWQFWKKSSLLPDTEGEFYKMVEGLTVLVEEDTESNNKGNINTFLNSRIHKSFTEAADQLCGLGYMDLSERIELSSIIGDSLKLFTELMQEKIPNIADIAIPRDIAMDIIKTALKNPLPIDEESFFKLLVAISGKCAICHKFSNHLQKHRKKRGYEGGEYTEKNIQLICPKCHKKVHHDAGEYEMGGEWKHKKLRKELGEEGYSQWQAERGKEKQQKVRDELGEEGYSKKQRDIANQRWHPKKKKKKASLPDTEAEFFTILASEKENSLIKAIKDRAITNHLNIGEKFRSAWILPDGTEIQVDPKDNNSHVSVLKSLGLISDKDLETHIWNNVDVVNAMLKGGLTRKIAGNSFQLWDRSRKNLQLLENKILQLNLKSEDKVWLDIASTGETSVFTVADFMENDYSLGQTLKNGYIGQGQIYPPADISLTDRLNLVTKQQEPVEELVDKPVVEEPVEEELVGEPVVEEPVVEESVEEQVKEPNWYQYDSLEEYIADKQEEETPKFEGDRKWYQFWKQSNILPDTEAEFFTILASENEDNFRFDPNSTENEARYRLIDPKVFDQDTIRRWKIWKDIRTPGVRFVVGVDTRDKEWKPQAIRFDKSVFDEEKANKWWEENKDQFTKEWYQKDWDIWMQKHPKDINPEYKIASIEDEHRSFSECMECSMKPDYELLWADGRAHVWFCAKHLPIWIEEEGKNDPKSLEIVMIKEITDENAHKNMIDQNTNPNIVKEIIKKVSMKIAATQEDIDNYFKKGTPLPEDIEIKEDLSPTYDIVQCAWCKKYMYNETHEYVEKPTEFEVVSHGICPECKAKVMEEFLAEKEANKTIIIDINAILTKSAGKFDKLIKDAKKALFSLTSEGFSIILLSNRYDPTQLIEELTLLNIPFDGIETKSNQRVSCKEIQFTGDWDSVIAEVKSKNISPIKISSPYIYVEDKGIIIDQVNPLWATTNGPPDYPDPAYWGTPDSLIKKRRKKQLKKIDNEDE